MRPLVLPADQTIHLDVSSRSHSFLISIDGNSFSCREHTPIAISRAPFTIKVIRPDDNDFFSTLREKMFWGTDLRK
jgi:NAD+ kinase